MLVMNLDDYGIILGLDLSRKSKIALMLYLNGVMITSEGCPCFVLCCNVTTTNATKKVKNSILTIDIEKAL
jgi:hypothetical protein